MSNEQIPLIHKFFLVLPLDKDFDGTEGKPAGQLPPAWICKISYDLEGAETYLLKMKTLFPEREWVIMESIATTKDKGNGIHSVIETIHW